MIEIPEAVTLSRQLTECAAGKEITHIVAGTSPHKFAWYYGTPEVYQSITAGKTFEEARAVGGMVEGAADDMRLLFSEGVNLRFLRHGERTPDKHQLKVSFSDASVLVASVQMYGGMGAFRAGENDNPYYLVSLEKPSPLDDEFDEGYFGRLLDVRGIEKLSVKALLATEQRIPGLGNGVLQDILYRSRLHPKRKVRTLADPELSRLFRSVKETLRDMAERGGRDTERDLYGIPGGYTTIMSRKTVATPCPACGKPIEKGTYMGGSVYSCPDCQPISLGE